MSLPNVDTFEHDISEEIKAKDATIADIAAAGGSVENLPMRDSRTSKVLLLMGALSVLVVVGIFVMLYVTYSARTASSVKGTTTQSNTPKGMPLSAISATMDDALGGNMGTIIHSDYGYTMQVLSYTNVYAYMLKNESAYADELAKAVGSARDTSTTTQPFMFTDVTLSNQNMRVGTSGSSTIVYAFINTTTLVVSSTTEGVLTLRSAILK